MLVVSAVAAERIQTKTFFDDSATSDRPIRHKLPAKNFIPTQQKNRAVSGIFGDKVPLLYIIL